MNEPYDDDPMYRTDSSASMGHTAHTGTAGTTGSTAHRGDGLLHPRNRHLLLLIGGATLALLLALAVWQNSGTRGAKNDYANANEHVLAKQKEVDDARRALEQRAAELRVVRAEAEVQAAKLGNTVQQQVGGAIDDARLDVPAGGQIVPPGTAGAARATDPYTGNAPVYYVRDQQGRFVPVTRP